MDESHARRKERDQALVRALCDITKRLRSELVEWLEEELKEQKISTQMICSILPDGLLKNRALQYDEDLDDLSFRKLPAAVNDQKGRVDEIWREFNDDPFDDYMYLEESVFRIERMARMIFAMRGHLDILSEPDADEAAADEDDG